MNMCKRIKEYINYDISQQVSKENLWGVKAICHDDAIFYGNFELKILYFHKIEISEKNRINRGKYDLGN